MVEGDHYSDLRQQMCVKISERYSLQRGKTSEMSISASTAPLNKELKFKSKYPVWRPGRQFN